MRENSSDRDKLATKSDQEFVFGSLFMIANRLQAMLDKEFQLYGLTARQWFLSIIVGGLFEQPPTLGEAAAAMGSTHQNAKQLALKLEEKGFLEFLEDERDGRAKRLRLTEKSGEFWASMQQSSERFMANLYKGMSPQEMSALRGMLATIGWNIEDMGKGPDGDNRS